LPYLLNTPADVADMLAAIGVSSASDVGSLMPGMLGDDGTTRRYLLIVLNNAEARSISGIPGSVAVITAKNGKLKMGQQGSNSDIGGFLDTKPVIPIKPELRAGFLSDVGNDLRDSVSIPNYPRAAELVAAIVGKAWKEKYDGVVAVDPVALGYALGGLGPVDIGDGIRINAGNAASILMHQIYLRYPNSNKRQDDAFKLAARRSFNALTSGRGNSVATIRGLVHGVRERRVLLWSRRPSEERRISTGGISGALSTERSKPEVGVFVNDAGSWKMTYYLHLSTRLDHQRCFSDGSQSFRVTAELRSDAPQDARRLPIVVAGNGVYVRPGEMRLHPLIVGPLGGRIDTMQVDGKPAPIGADVYDRRPIARVDRVIAPGETSIIVANIVTGPKSAGQPSLRATPGAGPIDMTVDADACPK